MAKFDVRRLRGTAAMVIDCQSDLIDGFDTRFTVPLVKSGVDRDPTSRLHPCFVIEGEKYVMATQLAAAVMKSELGPFVVSLVAHEYEIGAALDMLITGY